MTVVIDTNVLVQMLGSSQPFRALRDALEKGDVVWAVSTPVLAEYEEVIVRLAGQATWAKASRLIELIGLLRGSILEVSPSFRFRTITGDPDDDAFADCAIVADAEWLITSDGHFDSLKGAGYKPQPIRPEVFVDRFLNR